MASFASSPCSKAFRRILKKGRHLSVDLETNLLSVAILPLRRWSSLVEEGDFISRIYLILLGFASIPL